MATSLLGKRTRSSTDLGTVETSLMLQEHPADSRWTVSAPSSRVKRQARTVIFRDENEDPFVVIQKPCNAAQDDDPVDVDGASQSTSESAKSNLVARTVSFSPSKSKRHFNIIRDNGQWTVLEYREAC